jgi:hypothetical protein
MGLRDLFRRKPPVIDYDIEHDDDGWTLLGHGKGQRTDPIVAPARNSQRGVHPDQPNRAGRRLYVKLRQTRRFRKDVLGYGRWKRHHEGGETWHEHALDTARPVATTRRQERAERYLNYRAWRKSRGRRVTVPGSRKVKPS